MGVEVFCAGVGRLYDVGSEKVDRVCSGGKNTPHGSALFESLRAPMMILEPLRQTKATTITTVNSRPKREIINLIGICFEIS